MPDSAPSDVTPRRPGRPRRAPLTEDQIGRAALDLIDELGWAACTMSRLASRLGVRAPSLYHHIDGQRGVVDLVRALVVGEIHDPSMLEQPWDRAMAEFGLAYYRAFAGHPNTIQVLSTTPVRDATTLAMYEGFLQALVRDGWDAPRAFEALLGIEHLALGFAYEWNAEDLMLDSTLVEQLGAPLLAEATRGRTDQYAITEQTFTNLMHRYVEMFRHEFAVEATPTAHESAPTEAASAEPLPTEPASTEPASTEPASTESKGS